MSVTLGVGKLSAVKIFSVSKNDLKRIIFWRGNLKKNCEEGQIN